MEVCTAEGERSHEQEECRRIGIELPINWKNLKMFRDEVNLSWTLSEQFNYHISDDDREKGLEQEQYETVLQPIRRPWISKYQPS